VDPLTGVLLKPVSRPGPIAESQANQKSGDVRDLGSSNVGWSNSGALAESGPLAAGRSWLFLRTRNFHIYGSAVWNDDNGSSLDSMEV
jgi:hypothetical protein